MKNKDSFTFIKNNFGAEPDMQMHSKFSLVGAQFGNLNSNSPELKIPATKSQSPDKILKKHSSNFDFDRFQKESKRPSKLDAFNNSPKFNNDNDLDLK